jgi:hypothetical protein
VHPYDCTTPELLLNAITNLNGVVGAYYTNPPPIYDTEWGYTSVDFDPNHDGTTPVARQRQAVLVAREILNSCAAGMPLYTYYDIRDDTATATDRESNFGLLANNYTSKPALTAVQTIASAARGRTYKGLVPMPTPELMAMRFDSATNQVFAMWNAAIGSQIAISLPSNATAKDMLGNSVTLSGGYVLSESNGPIYVSIPILPPSAPVGLTAVAGDRSCALTWMASTNASSYTVERATVSGGAYTVVMTNPTALNYSDAGLSNGVAYYYVVVAANSAGTNQSSEVMARPFSLVRPIIQMTVGGNSVRCNWPSDHVGWRLQSQTNSSAVGLGTNWYDVLGANMTNQWDFSINRSNCSFYRLVSP